MTDGTPTLPAQLDDPLTTRLSPAAVDPASAGLPKDGLPDDGLALLALEQMDQGVILVDGDLTVRLVNGPLFEMFDRPTSAVSGTGYRQLIRQLVEGGEFGPGDPEAITLRHVDGACRADPPRFEHRRPNGRVLEVRTRLVPGGGFLRTFTDITERRRSADELAAQRHLLRQTLENIGQGIVLLDSDLRYIAWNHKALELLGVPEEMMRGNPVLADVARYQIASHLVEMPAGAPDMGEDVDAKLHYLLDRLGRPAGEFVYARPQGDGRYIEVRVVPLPDGGQVRTFTDITDRVIADEALRQSREILTGVIDAIPALIDVKDREGIVRLTNRYYRDLPDPASRPSPDRAVALERLVVESGQGVPFYEDCSPDETGGRHDWLVTKMPLTDDGGDVTHIVTVALDITARKRAEAELRDAQASLIQAEKLSSLAQMVAGVAHEVNTPIGVTLTAVSHLADELRRIRRLYEENRLRRSDFRDFLDVAWESTRMILTNIDRATGLIQSFKQVAADQASEERRPFDLAAYVDEVLLSLRPRLRRTAVVVDLDIPGGLIVDGYPGAFAQVLSNLIINALVHAFEEGKPGRIRLSAREEPAGWIDLRYADDGCGIAAEIRDRVFEPFFTTKRATGASGLGLSICANIMTGTMRGSIELEDWTGQGTRFVLRFPVALADPAPSTARASGAAPGQRGE
ncbi:PAS-domain containing protein [Azospirillum picis]|uniref:histidine kinase n=1 Tax=Azospirillum picis TaxID=488438 RepID=A0ABU0MFQ4_9PROT|nr:PAS-domain containing protein [Azospirillum picis]MBP2298700.1 PAS domain S-box-containing protein [Azospirillum picis]MDQ0532251.1 PAS domain S-box-containing protein [Azospirillum picis]